MIKPLLAVSALLITSCSLDKLNDVDNSVIGSEVPESILESREGALMAYNGALELFGKYLGRDALIIARFTDELTLRGHLTPMPFDDRNGRVAGGESFVPYVTNDSYIIAQKTRVAIEQAITLLEKYGISADNPKQARLRSYLGIILIMLGENYCSGVPLSLSEYGGTFIPGPGIERDSLFRLALSFAEKSLDTDTSSPDLLSLASGTAIRALLNVGDFKRASEFAEIMNKGDSAVISFWEGIPSRERFESVDPQLNYYITNNKGGNGITWYHLSPDLQDERVQIQDTLIGGVRSYLSPIRPRWFRGNSSILLASYSLGVLAKAEYYLNADRIADFIDEINYLRSLYKTVGGDPLDHVTDPGTKTDRIKLLFRERAYTSFGSGTRLGEMRRMVRQYGMSTADVYPMGLAPGAGSFRFGNNYLFAIEEPRNGKESNFNHMYGECFDYEP